MNKFFENIFIVIVFPVSVFTYTFISILKLRNEKIKEMEIKAILVETELNCYYRYLIYLDWFLSQ